MSNSSESRYDTILALLRDFCNQHLTDEYFDLAARMVMQAKNVEEKPMEKGRPESWAAGVVMALGYVNFLFEKSNIHYLAARDIATYFGMSVSNAGLRGQQIRDRMDLERFDPEFTTAEMRERDPFAQFVVWNDCLVSLSILPEETQRLIREARARGEDVELHTQSE